MANEEQVALLERGVAVWNAWREQHLEEEIDLTEADLTEVDLSGANLILANLSRGNLSRGGSAIQVMLCPERHA